MSRTKQPGAFVGGLLCLERSDSLCNPHRIILTCLARLLRQELYLCRKPERTLNDCVFQKLQLKKEIPGTPQGHAQIHEKMNPLWKGMQR